MAHACNPSYTGGSWFEASLGKYFKRLYLNLHKKGLVEWLKVWALSSNPSTIKKKKKRKKEL
jgi:hypothetical protein